MSDETVELELEYVTETDMAVSFDDGRRRIWLPKSQIDYDETDCVPGETIRVDVPEWLAYEKGLI